MSAEKFAAIFDGLQAAHGTFVIEKTAANGKNTGRAGIVREPRTARTWEEHLAGKRSLGIIPIDENNECRWGCIDIDQYPLDHKLLVEKIRRMKLPIIVCRSKSGGAHCFVFIRGRVSAKDMQTTLQQVSAALGYGGSEIFPKQVALRLDRGDVGNFLNLPYFNAEEGLRYAINDDGTAATLDEFFSLYEAHALTPEALLALQITDDSQSSWTGAPPCLQIICASKISEGGRNNGLFNIGVYLRKAFPDSWETEILTYNLTYLEPPLPLSEVNIIAKQLGRKDYAYKCSDAPINAHCDKVLCRTRKFGVGGGAQNALVGNLRKYNSAPPVWFIDVNGEPLELDTDALIEQKAFQRACMEQLNFMPGTMSKQNWEARIGTLMTEMRDNESAIVEVAEDASINGQFYDYLEEFCRHLQQAQDREEILLRRPWTDEEQKITYFRLRDFEAHLRKNKFFEFKSHKIAQRLRDINGQSVLLKIKGRPIRVWAIPAYGFADIEFDGPNFNDEEVPF